MKRFLSTLLGLTLLAQTAVAQTPRVLDGDKVSRTSSTRNYVRNPDAQLSNVTGVTLTTATASRSTTTPVGETGTEFNVAITSANGSVDFLNSGATQAMLGGQQCEVGFVGRGFQSTSRLQAFDGTNVLATFTFGALTNTTPVSVPFPCPLDPSTVRVRLTDTATLAGTNEVAGVYFGRARNIGDAGNITNEILFTPVIRGSGTDPTVSYGGGRRATWRRVGTNVEVNIFISISTITGGSGSLEWAMADLGIGAAIDVAKISQNSLQNLNTRASWFDASAVKSYNLEPYVLNSNVIRFYKGDSLAGSDLSIADLASSDQIGLRFSVPIANWPTASSAVTPAQSQLSRAYYSSNNAQSIPNNTDTIVNFEDVNFDVNSEVVIGAAWKFTAKKAGYYKVEASVLLGNSGAWNTGEVVYLDARKNGTTITRSFWKVQAAYTDNPSSVYTSGTVFLNVGDYVDYVINQNSGAAVPLIGNTIYNYANIESIDGPNQPVFIQSPVKAAGTGTAPLESEVGYRLIAYRTSLFSQSTPSIGTYYDVTDLSITPPAGVWDLTTQCPLAAAWSSGAGYAITTLSLRTGSTVVNNAAGGFVGDNAGADKPPGVGITSAITRARVSITTPTTYKTSIRMSTFSGSPSFSTIQAHATITGPATDCYIEAIRANDR